MAVGDKKAVVMEADRAIANGIATLGADGILALTQRPTVSGIMSDDGSTTLSTLLANSDPRNWGLGDNAKTLDVQGLDLDTLKTTGWYTTSSTSFMYSWLNGPEKLPRNGGIPIIRIESSFSNFLMQTYIYLPETSTKLYIAKRICVDDTFYPWEYVNPPMELGVEYRTTKRHLGKPVYTKLVNFGELPNASSKDIVAGDATCSPIRVAGYVYKTGENERFETIDGGILPTSSVQSDYNDVWISALRQVSSSGSAQTNMIIHIRTRKDFSSKLVRVQVWYTKTTD